jgi:enoyl-CoA hydratase/carnithine racemase
VTIESHLDSIGIRTITLNRPPANAINFEMMEALRDAFEQASLDWSTRVVVLDSANPRFFCGGWDVKMSHPRSDPASPSVIRYGGHMARDVFRAIYECGVPVIAKVRGIAVGAGFLYACLADFTIAAETASFGQFEIKISGVGGAGIVRRMMSEQAMRYLSWGGELVSVQKLLDLGAGIHCVPDAVLDKEVEAVAVKLASRDPRLTRHSKRSFNQVERLGPLDAYGVEQMHSQIVTGGEGRVVPQPDHDLDRRRAGPSGD